MAIDIDRLSVQYPDRDRPAIRDLTTSVREGEAVVVTGPSGCGKSTLCRAIAGFVPEMIPARVTGRISAAGLPVGRTDSARIAQQVGFIQQDPDAQICTLRVEREVAFGPENLRLSRDEVRARVESSLRAVGIDHLRDRETTHLSGGEKQRLAIAAILAMHPRILLLDEPTANLDPDGAKGLFDLLGTLQRDRGMTLLVVEHRIRPLRALAPRLLVLDRGRLVPRHDRERIEPREMGVRAVGSGGNATIAIGSPRVSLSEVGFGYEAPLFRELSFEIRSGELLAVIGPNGGGKTSLLRLIAGLADPTAGRIDRPESDRIGYVFQHPHHQIFERTVARELSVDRPEAYPGDDARWLAEGRLDGLAGAAPLSLSLGEQRRLTVLTALRRRPELLLLDEPFIGQDRRNVDWIAGRLRRHCAEGGSVVLVSHDVPLVEALAHRVLYLGDTPRYGPPDAVFAELEDAGRTPYLPDFWERIP